jgi:26S proteasome non-ATPase regulatory subunit 9
MKTVDKFLEQHFASLGDEDDEPTVPTVVDFPTRDVMPEALDQPFAKVNSVIENSPAAIAGMKAGDAIRNFGYVNFRNHDELKKVAECVQGNEGVRSSVILQPDHHSHTRTDRCPLQQNVLVKVSRTSGSQTQELQLTLVPQRNWGGRGLLGCHILPLR